MYVGKSPHLKFEINHHFLLWLISPSNFCAWLFFGPSSVCSRRWRRKRKRRCKTLTLEYGQITIIPYTWKYLGQFKRISLGGSTIHMVNNHVPMIGQSIIYIDPSSSSTSRGEDLPFNFGPSVHHGHDSQALILGLLSFQLSLCTQIFHEATSEDARESTCFFWAETVRVPKK